MLFFLDVGLGFLLQQRGEHFIVIRVHRRGRQIAEHLARGGRAPAAKLPLRGRKRPAAVGGAAAANLCFFSGGECLSTGEGRRGGARIYLVAAESAGGGRRVGEENLDFSPDGVGQPHFSLAPEPPIAPQCAGFGL